MNVPRLVEHRGRAGHRCAKRKHYLNMGPVVYQLFIRHLGMGVFVLDRDVWRCGVGD